MRPELRTQIALQAQDLASTFNQAFAKTRIPPANYVAELTAPEGPSTGGGVQALQRLRLVPQAPGFPTLVVGGANQADGTSELRTYAHVDALHQEHFRKPVALDRVEYEKFLEMAKNLLMTLRLKPTFTEAPVLVSQHVPPAVEHRSSSGNRGVVVGIIAAVAAVAAMLGVVGTWLYLKP